MYNARSCFVSITIISLALFLLTIRPAHAYLDPGTGSYVFQVAIAVTLGAAFTVKAFWERIKISLQKLLSRKTTRMISEQLASSFRDPSGFIFRHEGIIYRQVQDCYREDYDCLMQSGLYARLIELGALIPHEEVDTPGVGMGGYKVIKPALVPFISYPYEWSFSQLQDAALLTLRIQQVALEYGMTLKDASAYNVQFIGGNPALHRYPLICQVYGRRTLDCLPAILHVFFSPAGAHVFE